MRDDSLEIELKGPPIDARTIEEHRHDSRFQATSQAIDQLMEAGILKQVTVGRRSRAFEAPSSSRRSRHWSGSSLTPKETRSSRSRSGASRTGVDRSVRLTCERSSRMGVGAERGHTPLATARRQCRRSTLRSDA